MAACTCVQHVCSEALRMRSACHAISAWRLQEQTTLFFSGLLNRFWFVQFTDDVHPGSRGDRRLSHVHGGAATVDRAPDRHQDLGGGALS